MKINLLDLRLVALCTTYFLLPVIACPSKCVCKWKNGKRFVECADKHLRSIPNSIDSETQVLDLSGNDLQVLQKETFILRGILDLQKVYLSSCKLQKIDSHAFKGLANLVELDLSNNYLTIVPSTNFVFLPSLMRLILNNNPITSIKSHCFQHLSYLNTLELSDCQIELIEKDAFSGLHHLEWLRLNRNKLTSIQGENLFPDTLRGIDLQNNNWKCDCNLRDLHGWLTNFNMPQAVEPICSFPERLKKRTIKSVPDIDFACQPKISPTSLFIEANEWNNITLECVVKALPQAKISWLFQGQFILNNSRSAPEYRNVYYLESGVEEKKSELFVFNVSIEDNGTYSCIASNTGGKAQANFTVKVILKDKPVVTVVTFPQRHLVVIVTIVFLVIVLLIAIIAVVLLKFKTDTRSRKKKESGKDVALCNQILPSNRNNGTLSKSNGSLIVNAHSHHALQYTVQTNRDYESSDVYQSNIMKSFVDRNPDLISDAETVANNTHNENAALSLYKTQPSNGDDFEVETTFETSTSPRQVTWQDQQNYSTLQQNNVANMYQHSADVHLNPGCFLDSEGYPYDYGLPKHPCRQAPLVSNYAIVTPFYQTLPHNRNKGQKLVCKFAKDMEFNSMPQTCPNFDQCSATNVRRTLEGYPVQRNRQIAFVGNGTVYYNDEFVPSPPEGYKTEQLAQCCSPAEGCSPWVNPKGTCAMIVPMSLPEGPGRCYQVETRCVDTQTSEGRLPCENFENNLKPHPQVSNAKCVTDMCSESPDEGYVGDANDI